jgi:hypothetical protein
MHATELHMHPDVWSLWSGPTARRGCSYQRDETRRKVMKSHYRKPSIHVAGITSILLKGSFGSGFDFVNGMGFI